MILCFLYFFISILLKVKSILYKHKCKSILYKPKVGCISPVFFFREAVFSLLFISNISNVKKIVCKAEHSVSRILLMKYFLGYSIKNKKRANKVHCCMKNYLNIRSCISNNTLIRLQYVIIHFLYKKIIK